MTPIRHTEDCLRYGNSKDCPICGNTSIPTIKPSILKGVWKSKIVNIINPDTKEILGKVQIKPTDFTRRFFETKIKSWKSFPLDASYEISKFFFSRFHDDGQARLIVEADEKYLTI